MSTDYTDYAIIGFCRDMLDFLAPLVEELPEKSHMEERYNPKTGARLEDVKVIDQEAGEAWVFDGEAYDRGGCAFELVDAIAKKVGASISTLGDSRQGDDTFVVCIEPKSLRRRKDGGYSLEDVWESRKELAKIEKKLRELGLDPGTMGVFSALDIG